MQRIIITGYFGSGKTEIALHLAQEANAQGPVTLVDLDVVNPYFTAAAHRDRLKASGIAVIAPVFSGSGVDVPALSGGVRAAIMQKGPLIIDVGGDKVGATVLGSHAPLIAQTGGAELWMAVNPFRPFTDTPQAVMALMAQLSEHARLPLTGLINNANLLEHTLPEHLVAGEALLREVSERSGLPIVRHCGTSAVLDAVDQPLQGAPLILHPANSPFWLRDGVLE